MDKPEKISGGEKTAFAVGEIYGSGGVAILSLVYLTFLTLIVKIPPAIAGTIIMVARIWDAFSDPIMGSISDNTRTRYGRRRPYIIASSILIIIAMFLLFMPIQNWESLTAKIVYVVFAHLFYSTVSTVFNVPYLSLTSEISENVKQRSSMNFLRLAIGMLATAVCFLLSSLFLQMQKDGVISSTQFSLIVAGVFSVFFAVPVLLCGIFSKERTPLPQSKLRFSLKNFANTFKLKCFRRLLLMYVFSFVCNEIIANLIIIYVFNVAQHSDFALLGFKLPALVNMFMLIGAALVMPISLTMLQKKIAKPIIFMCGIPLFMAGALALACFPSNSTHPQLLILCSTIAGMGFGMAQMIPWLVFPDIVDVAELKSNDRNPGAYNGTMTFFKKFASGMAVFLIGLVLQTTGFDEQLGTSMPQPQSAVKGMRLVIGICIPICLAIAFVGAFIIKITTKKSERIRYFIDVQREGKIDDLQEEEKSELDKLKKELF